jgi:hypothetical protein
LENPAKTDEEKPAYKIIAQGAAACHQLSKDFTNDS